eukprot:CAMPEP_0197687088 /NCGR_PEP_ID=MMETSP1338-20131121/103507_1 /TAXON_ID=43686 ORGANISM="Pelagodinium beii, Strain RCC1491" /NCGR_SAMPLE_ID=MMETSP1338 /ASSEMBLY_ACC=CAM_ASM_000754 /LENGTH=96 /DNA_ID=CAMNT_0043269127 /DNA_START=18 /DNA_END=305 /DNA_ORIENTATION=-
MKDLSPVILVNTAAALAVRVIPGPLPAVRALTIGNMFSYISCRMILAAVVHMSYPHRQICYVAYPALLVMIVEHIAVSVGGSMLGIYEKQLSYMVV